MNKQIQINQLPAPTWRWIKGNQVQLPWGEETAFCLTQIDNICTITPAQGTYSHGQLVYTAQAGTTMTVLQCIGADKAAQGLRLHTHLQVEQGATLQLVQVFHGGAPCNMVNQVKANCAESGKVEVLQILANQGDLYSDVTIDLDGDNSDYSMVTGYIAQQQVLDMNLLVNHKGCQTTSNIQFEGVIQEKGYKTFRGTIDIQEGASGADGSEHENVVLLGEDIRNLTIPVILCHQEDVHGAHGASISQLDEEVLFYLNSRGIGREQAEQMILRAKLECVVNHVQAPELKDKIHQVLKEVLAND